MTPPTKDNWSKWNEERETFASRNTQGFSQDIEALKKHILKLQEVCPKDKAGGPVSQALNYLNKLRRAYNTVTEYLEQLTPPISASQD